MKGGEEGEQIDSRAIRHTHFKRDNGQRMIGSKRKGKEKTPI
jgi:hypothetical protein